MIPVDQTCFDIPGGNCFQAALASVLELPLDKVPHFCGDGTDENWEGSLNCWLFNMFGMYSVCVCFPRDEKVLRWIPRDAIAIGVVLSACRSNWIDKNGNSRPAMHAVVCNGDGKIIHDPHPLREHMNSDVVEFRVFCISEPASITKGW